MIKKWFLLLAMITLLPSVIAETEYNNIGGTDYDFLQGVGGFKGGLLTTTQTRGLTDGDHVPLVGDLDGNGVSEIVIVDNGVISIYQNTTLVLVDSISLLSGSADTYSQPIIFDIDEDGFKEIIIASEAIGDGNVSIINWNGTSLSLQITFTINGTSTKAGTREIMIACTNRTGGEVPSCLWLQAESPSAAGNEVIKAQSFNATQSRSTEVVAVRSLNVNHVCFPSVPVIAVADYDNDGRDEFIFTAIYGHGGLTDELNIHYIDVFNGGELTVEQSIFKNINPIVDPQVPGNTCSGNVGRYITSPLVGDFKTGGGLETVVAYNNDPNSFKIEVFSEIGVSLGTHPVTNADGELIGNLMAATIFADSVPQKDYCVFSQEVTEQELALVCGSRLTGKTDLFLIPTPHQEWIFFSDGSFNYTNVYNNPSIIAHLSDMDGQEFNLGGQGAINAQELITSHGVFQLTDTSSGFGSGKDLMTQTFALDIERSCIVVDYENTGSADFICVADTQVTYINDNLVNGVATILPFPTQNPCIDAGAVAINNTFETTFVVVDQNDFPLVPDPVFSRVTLYSGSSNAQVSGPLPSVSGDPIIHSFVFPPGGINLTGTVNLFYEAWDSEHNTTISTQSETFVVGLSGVNFGDCLSGGLVADVDDVEGLAGAIPDDQVDNGITTGLITVSALTGLGGLTIWIIIMIAMSLGVWGAVHSQGLHGSAAMGTIAILNVLMIFLGSQLGIFSTALIIIMITVAVVIIGIFLGRFLTGAESSNG